MNYELLRAFIRDTGIKVSVLAEKIGMTRQSLHAKLSGDRVFTQSEIMALKIALHMNDDDFMHIFFTEWVPETATSKGAKV